MPRHVRRAAELDASDPLAAYRSRFLVDDDLTYLDGNSLGRMPAAVPEIVGELLNDGWGRRLVMGWDEWIDWGVELGSALAPIIGASRGEVAVGDQTTVNLYKLACAAMDASGRSSVLTDAGNFPSDLYVLDAIARERGGQLIMAPEDATAEVLARHLDASVGVVALTHVSYRSGWMHDGARITRLAHENGSLMLWDLAHSAGAVPVELDRWDADLAVGCTYKYLNGGPGAPAFLYVREDLQSDLNQPITGWFGHARQFDFDPRYEPSPSIRRFLTGTPPIISMAAAREGVAITREAGIAAIRAKSVTMSELFIGVIQSSGAEQLTIASPLDPERRGSHVAIRHPAGYELSRALRHEGIIVDFREPDVMRFGFAPLYNRYAHVVEAAAALIRIERSGAHTEFSGHPRGVT